MKNNQPTTIDLETAIGMLRQWLNEERIRDAKRFVTNDDLHHWLDKAIDAYCTEREREARIDELLRLRNAMTGDGIHNGDAMDYSYERVQELRGQ